MKILLLILLSALTIEVIAAAPKIPFVSGVSDFVGNITNEVKNTTKNVYNSLKDGVTNIFTISKDAARSAVNTTTDYIGYVKGNVNHHKERVVTSFNMYVSALRNRLGCSREKWRVIVKANKIEAKMQSDVLAAKDEFEKLNTDVRELLEIFERDCKSIIESTNTKIESQMTNISNKFNNRSSKVVKCSENLHLDFDIDSVDFSSNLRNCSIVTKFAKDSISKDLAQLSKRFPDLLPDIMKSIQTCLDAQLVNVTDDCLEDVLRSSGTILTFVLEDLKSIKENAKSILRFAENRLLRGTEEIIRNTTNKLAEIDDKVGLCIKADLGDIKNEIDAKFEAAMDDLKQLDRQLNALNSNFGYNSKNDLNSTMTEIIAQLVDIFENDSIQNNENQNSCVENFLLEVTLITIKSAYLLEACYSPDENSVKNNFPEALELSENIFILLDICFDAEDFKTTEVCLRNTLNSSISLLEATFEEIKEIYEIAQTLHTPNTTNTTFCSENTLQITKNLITDANNRVRVCAE